MVSDVLYVSISEFDIHTTVATLMMLQHSISAGTLCHTPLRELTTLHRTTTYSRLGWGGDTSSLFSTRSASTYRGAFKGTSHGLTNPTCYRPDIDLHRPTYIDLIAINACPQLSLFSSISWYDLQTFSCHYGSRGALHSKTGRVICVCDWLRDATLILATGRGFICYLLLVE